MERTVAVPVPEVPKERQVTQLIPQGQISDRVVEQIADVVVEEIPEQTVDAVQVIPQERLQQRTQAKDATVQVAQKTVEIPQEKIEAKICLEKCCVTVRNATVEGKPKVGVVKPRPQRQVIEKAMDIPAGQQRQVHMSRTVQKNVQTPKQSPDKVVNIPINIASSSAPVKVSWRVVEVARVIPQERIKPAGERASLRERIRQFKMNGGISRASTVEVPRVPPDDGQSEDAEGEAPNKRRKQESDPDSRALCTFLSAAARATRERSGWMTLPTSRQGPEENARAFKSRGWMTFCLK